VAVTVTADADVLTKAKRHVVGDEVEVRGTIAFGAGYPTGGEPVTASQFGLQRLNDLLVFPTGGEDPSFDKANGKVKLFTADGTEAVNASNPAVSVRFVARGR